MKIYGSCKPVDGFPADALIDEFVGNDKASKMENFWKIVDEISTTTFWLSSSENNLFKWTVNEGRKYNTIWIKFNENNNTILMKLGDAYHEIEFLINLRRFSWILH